jgi:hypothetical protein
VWEAIVPATDGHLFILENPTIYSLYVVPVHTFDVHFLGGPLNPPGHLFCYWTSTVKSLSVPFLNWLLISQHRNVYMLAISAVHNYFHPTLVILTTRLPILGYSCGFMIDCV